MRGAILCLILIPLLFIALPNEFTVYATPTWLKTGTYVNYQVNVTAVTSQGTSAFSGTVSWRVESINGSIAAIRQKAGRDSYTLENVLEVDADSRLVLTIDGLPVNSVRTYFWVNADPERRIGSLVDVENLTCVIEGEDQVTVSNLTRSCWFANASFTMENVTGAVGRWYDKETGLLLRVYTTMILSEAEPVGIEVVMIPTATNAFSKTLALRGPVDVESWELLFSTALVAFLSIGEKYILRGGR